jgi:hypothetical protein
MSTLPFTEFVESIETQFTDLGLELTKIDDDLAWLYFHNDTHRATVRATVYTGTNFLSIKFVVESFSPEPNENGLFDGTIWSGFDTIETAIIRLLKVISDVKRESLNA